MAVKRLDHVGVVVEDLPAAIAFYEALGLTATPISSVEGAWVDTVVGLKQVQVDIAFVSTPDGAGRLELTAFRNPALIPPTPHPAPANVVGLRRIMFAVDDIHATVERLKPHGGELIGEIARYEDMFLLCYLRGPGGAIVALAEEL